MVLVRWQVKEKLQREHFSATEVNRYLLKGLLADPFFSFEDRIFFFKRLQLYFFKSSISFFRNSCIFSGNAKSVFRVVKLCRHFFKSKASSGLLTGFRKSSF